MTRQSLSSMSARHKIMETKESDEMMYDHVIDYTIAI